MARNATPKPKCSSAAKAGAKMDKRAACAPPAAAPSSAWERYGRALAVARLAFNCAYLHHGFREAVRGTPVEHAFVFWAHLGWTPLWPVGAIGVDKASGVTQALCCRYAKCLHVCVQAYVETFCNYIIYLDRVDKGEDVQWMYAAQVLAAGLLVVPAMFPSIRLRNRVGAGAFLAYALLGVGYAVYIVTMSWTAIYKNNVDCALFARSIAIMGILPFPLRLPMLALTHATMSSGHLPQRPGTWDWGVFGSAEWSYKYWDPDTARKVE